MKPNNHWSFRAAHSEIDISRILREAQENNACIVRIRIGKTETTLVRPAELRSAYKHANLNHNAITWTEGYRAWKHDEKNRVVSVGLGESAPVEGSLTDGSWQLWREPNPEPGKEWPRPEAVLAKYQEYLASQQRVTVEAW